MGDMQGKVTVKTSEVNIEEFEDRSHFASFPQTNYEIYLLSSTI